MIETVGKSHGAVTRDRLEIAKPALVALVAKLLAERRVGGPVVQDGVSSFGFIEAPAELALDSNVTFASFKSLTFPTSETLVSYELRDIPSAQAVIEATPTVAFGLHPCDLHALKFMDTHFGGGVWDAPADPNYAAHRAALTVIGVDCMRPCDSHAFCRDMGALDVADGYDALMVDVGDSYVVEIASGGGKAVFDLADTRPAGEAAVAKVRDMRARRSSVFPRRLEAGIDRLPELLKSNFSHPVWEAMGDKCLSCGSCTAVCPTCYCFDVVERLQFGNSGGERCRIWDSCQLRSFATVAGGHNFRAERSARQRHFTMHKSAYIPDAYGVAGCVGCGRCIRACPADISQIEIYSRIAGQR